MGRGEQFAIISVNANNAATAIYASTGDHRACESEIVVKRRIDRVRPIGQEERVAIGLLPGRASGQLVVGGQS
jgi:hypothetical protein